ncbi:MAG TPA: hypothetical protein DDX91_08505 [Ruminococcaceae bacterium]|nr:hypothetical protein [Oscillospiraceae bacterium]
MKKELQSYIEQVEQWIREERLSPEIMARIRVNIGFFQHERLIHLIVTMTFALLTVGSLAMCFCVIYFLPLFLLFLGLEIPYIYHYYKLENGTQRLQRLYRQAEEIAAGIKDTYKIKQ